MTYLNVLSLVFNDMNSCVGIVTTNSTILNWLKMKIRIVEFQSKYYDFVLNRIAKTWNVSESRSNRYISSFLTSENFSKCYIALADGRPVGTGMFAIENDVGCDFLTPWVMGLWVEPSYRGNGIGQRLTKARFKHARDLGYNHIYLDTQNASDYHKKFGWIDTGIVARYQGMETQVM